MIQACPGKNMRFYPKNNKTKNNNQKRKILEHGSSGEHLPSKHKALHQTPLLLLLPKKKASFVL
jgi:hypothetical protein